MKRRSFLKILSAAPAIAAAPALAKTDEAIAQGVNGIYGNGLIAKLNGVRIPLEDCLNETGGLTSPKYAKPMDNISFTTGFMKFER